MALQIQERQLSWLDHARLFTLLRSPQAGQPRMAAPTLAHAKDVLDFAELVEPQFVRPTVVTMRSRVRLLRARGEPFEVTLCYPDEAQPAEGCISVFSPLGLSLLGAERGEVVEWSGPGGEAHFAEVAEILYQPEAAGDLTR
jgi:regulator of nucleoside diphosphate kinase